MLELQLKVLAVVVYLELNGGLDIFVFNVVFAVSLFLLTGAFRSL